MAVQSTTNTADLITEQVANLLVQPLEAASFFLASGPKIFDSSEPFRIPTLLSGFTPTFVAENGLIPDGQNADFGHIVLMPSDRTSIKQIVRFSAEILRQSNVALDAVLKNRLVNDVAQALDDALLNGDGSDDSILGLLNQPGPQQGVLDVTEPDSFLDGIALASAAEVVPNRWFLNGSDFIAVRKIKDNNNTYILESDITSGTTYRLFGIPVTITNKMPSGTAVLANMAEIAVVRDVAPTVTILNERYAEYDQKGIRVVTRYDLGLIRPEGVVILTAATTDETDA